MNESEYWNLFCQTGKVDDYLHYACTSEEGQCQNKKECEQDGRDSNGNGIVRISHWGIR